MVTPFDALMTPYTAHTITKKDGWEGVTTGTAVVASAASGFNNIITQ